VNHVAMSVPPTLVSEAAYVHSVLSAGSGRMCKCIRRSEHVADVVNQHRR
jgi:hypothetical protein